MSEQCAHPDWKCKTCDLETTYYSDMVEENRALKAENERLKVALAENPHLGSSHKDYLEIEKLTEQNRILAKRVEEKDLIISTMKEALEFYSGTVEKQVEIWDKSLLIDRGDKARETLAKVAALEGKEGEDAEYKKLSEENKRLKDENRKILKELNATTQGRENAYKEQEQLTEQNRIMKEALEFYATYLDDSDVAYCASCAEYFPETGQELPLGTHASEALAKCKELEK